MKKTILFKMPTEKLTRLYRQKKFDALQPLAMAALKKLKMEITPENLEDMQEELALQRHLTPPSWNGWITCIKCGIRPCGGNYTGEEVTTCSFCIPPNYEKMAYHELVDPAMIAICNRSDYYLKKAKENDDGVEGWPFD